MQPEVYLLEFIRRRTEYDQVLSWLDESLFSNDAHLDVFRGITKGLRFHDCRLVDYPQLTALIQETSKDPNRWEDAVHVVKQMAKIRNRKKVISRMAYRFLRGANVLGAIQTTLDDIGAGKEVDVARLVGSLRKLESIGTSGGISTDLFSDPESRVADLFQIGQPVITALAPLTEVLDGGPASGDLVTVIALPDGGKSLFLLDTAATAVENGFRTFVAVLERGRSCISRLDCRLCNHTAKWLYQHPKKFIDLIRDRATKNAPLRIVDYSRVEIGLSDLHRDITRFTDDFGDVDCVVIDYGDLLRSTRRYESKRHELSLVWIELKRMAEEFNCPVYAATQSNRAGTKVDTLDMCNVAEDWSKMGTTDIVITMNQTPKEKRHNEARVYVAKTKKSGGSLIVPIRIDRLRCKMNLIGEDHDRGREDGTKEVARSRSKEILKRTIHRKGSGRKAVVKRKAR